MRCSTWISAALLTLLLIPAASRAQRKAAWGDGWQVHIGDLPASLVFAGATADSLWQDVTLPRAWNEDEAFARPCAQLSDTVLWYRKSFHVDDTTLVRYVEFEGVRQACDVYLNGQRIGGSEDGVMAFGVHLSPALRIGDNLLCVRVDTDWDYQSSDGPPFQWNDRNFNPNYGGIVKRVFLHTCPPVHHTLPLLSSLGTCGTYVYATDIDVADTSLTLHAEAQIVNLSPTPRTLRLGVCVDDADGRTVATFQNDTPTTVSPGDTLTLCAQAPLRDIHLWSWGDGYLYNVRTQLIDADDGALVDELSTITGFRKTRFADGQIFLNDRTFLVHGFAQRSSNEWPGVGPCVPPWLSDYSNGLMVEAGADLVRWMHVTPSKQDVESCDRVGLPQALPAGDAEKDAQGTQWLQRLRLMQDAIVYMRNNPSVLFYEAGNKGISEEHMQQMKALRDRYDPYGGRAMGCREMLDPNSCAEYGGEMLYVNKSAGKPLWAMEYCRDEGLRRYWDDYSPPFHREGDGPLYRGQGAAAYNHNQDALAIEHVVRWNEIWQERPGLGRRCSSGGVKIIFSDTQTHARGEAGYRTSGVVDALRLPKDSYYAHQVMWDGWVEPTTPRLHIIGHWTYPALTQKPVYVVANTPRVELCLNGRSLGPGRRSHHFLFTFDSVAYEPGTLVAIAQDTLGNTLATDTLYTAAAPHHIQLCALTNPCGWQADGADLALIQVSVVDSLSRTCPTDGRTLHFTLQGPAEWRGGIAAPRDSNRMDSSFFILHSSFPQDSSSFILHSSFPQDSSFFILHSSFQGGDNPFHNYALSTCLPLDAGTTRVLLRSTNNPGDVTLTAQAEGLPPASICLTTEAPHQLTSDSLSGKTAQHGLRTFPDALETGLRRFSDTLETGLRRFSDAPGPRSGGDIAAPRDTSRMDSSFFILHSSFPDSVSAASNNDDAPLCCDDNEGTEWRSDGTPQGAAITFHFSAPTAGHQLTSGCLTGNGSGGAFPQDSSFFILHSSFNEVCLKLAGWRNTIYPLALYDESDSLLWQGDTYPCLGYVHIPLPQPVCTQALTLRMTAPARKADPDEPVKELAGGQAALLDQLNHKPDDKFLLRILEIEFLHKE